MSDKETPPSAGEWLDDMEDKVLRVPELEKAIRELGEVYEGADGLVGMVGCLGGGPEDLRPDYTKARDAIAKVSDQTKKILKRLGDER